MIDPDCIIEWRSKLDPLNTTVFLSLNETLRQSEAPWVQQMGAILPWRKAYQ